MPIIMIMVTDYELPTKTFARYRGSKVPQYGIMLKTSEKRKVQARISFKNYNTRADDVKVYTFALFYKF